MPKGTIIFIEKELNMNARVRNIIKDYLTFSRRERNGLIIFFVLGFIVYFSSRHISFKKPIPDKTAFQQELAKLTISIDSSTHGRYTRDDNNDAYYQPKRYESRSVAKAETFPFDPNTLDAAGWKRLGLRDKTVNTIQNFIAKGYKFRQAEDLRKIYGLRKEDADRLMPYVHIAGRGSTAGTPFSPDAKTSYPKNISAEPAKKPIIDINTADTSAFISLPGIGNKLALRIISFRQKLGGFSSVDQLGETYGIADSTFQMIKPRLQCINPTLKTININTADVNMLRTHPYIKWNIANAIINFRTQHGNFNTLEELKKIDIITDDVYRKIAPYLNL